jgi:hypothetical protein
MKAAEPEQPSEPVKVAEPVKPVAVEPPAEPVKSVEPVQVAEPVKSAEPVQVAEPAPPVVQASAAPVAAPALLQPLNDDPGEWSPRIGIVKPAAFVAARGNDNTTIFLGPAPIDVDTMTSTIWLTGDETFVAPAGRRVGEFQASPIPMRAEQWKTSGRVKARALASGGRVVGTQQRMQARDLVEITLPAGMDTVPGTQVVTVSTGADLGRGVRLAIPTGVLTLESPRNGVAVARVTTVYGVIDQGQAVVPHVEAPAAPETGAVSPVEATVRWIAEAPLLPSIQAYLVLAPAEGAELATGDRFELLSESAGGSRVGEARVVRVTADGVTAIVTQQEQPAIRVGMRARRVGRAP